MTSQLIIGDCRKVLASLPGESVDCCVTSPPYFGLRDYGKDGQIGLEQTPDVYVQELVGVFREVRRVLRNDGTLWLNLGDSYSAGGRGGGAEGSIQSGNIGSTTGVVFDAWKVPGFKPKNLLGIPWRVALALQADGWYLRQDIIWSKPNPMPESVTDRCTKAHEYIFLLSKSDRYYFNNEAIKEPSINEDVGGMRNKRSVWTVTTRPCREAHFATYPTDLIVPCILAGSKSDGVVLDPFNGAGTTGLVSLSNGRRYVGIELNPDYAEISMRRFGLMATLVNLRDHEDCQREVEI
jgi:DNA modification methylase